MKKQLTNKKGFTLIELVIVVAVLAILAVIAVPAVGGITEKAKDATDKSNLALYQSAIERWNVDNNDRYPSDAAGVLAAVKKYTNQKAIKAPHKKNYYYVATGITSSDGTEYTAGQLLLADTDPDGTANNIVLVN